MPPTYSIKAFRAIGHLKKSQNDIEIYIEDSSIANAYNFFIRNLLPKHVRFSSVIAIGSREKVLEACNNDQVDRYRKRLYIIDADMDVLTSAPKPRLRHLYRLKAYCFENLILHQSAVENVSLMWSTSERKEDLSARLSWERKKRDFAAEFGPLFVVYALVQKLMKVARPITVKNHVFSLCFRSIDGEHMPDKMKIRALCKKLLLELHRSVEKDVCTQIRRKWMNNAMSISVSWPKIVSGKDYLLPYLLHLLNRSVGFSGSQKHLTVQLASQCPSTVDMGLKKAIMSMVK